MGTVGIDDLILQPQHVFGCVSTPCRDPSPQSPAVGGGFFMFFNMIQLQYSWVFDY